MNELRVPSTGLSFNTGNITGSPISTLIAILVAVGQYLAVQGGSLPHDWSGWVSLVLGALVAVGGALGGPKRVGGPGGPA